MAAIVAGPIGHLPDNRPGTLESLQDAFSHGAVGALLAARHVVDLTGQPVVEHEGDGVGVVVHEEPVAVAVRRHRAAWVLIDGVTDEEREELLRVLPRAVRVGASRDHGIQSEGGAVGATRRSAAALAAA